MNTVIVIEAQSNMEKEIKKYERWAKKQIRSLGLWAPPQGMMRLLIFCAIMEAQTGTLDYNLDKFVKNVEPMACRRGYLTTWAIHLGKGRFTLLEVRILICCLALVLGLSSGRGYRKLKCTSKFSKKCL